MASVRVLIAEDNEKSMKLFRDVLQVSGYETFEATTGEQAVELATQYGPALVLMDIRLPDIDGLEALGRLRTDERTASIPVVALTAQSMHGDRERFLSAGFDGYISKPVNVVELVGTVKQVLRRGRSMSGGENARILVVDDVPENLRLLEAVLAPRGYDVVSATDGPAALELVESAKPDLVLLDVVMPQMDGYAVCRRLREREETAVLPVIMVTSSAGPERTHAIEAGADDFIPKPLNQHELLTRVGSLLRIKHYHDTIKAQAAELAELNGTLEERVQRQVEELERTRRLQRFLSPQLADAIVSSGDESILRSHRRQVAMFFADLRGWTNFVDAVEPEELMRVLGEFHGTIGGLVTRFDATVGLIEGDGVQLFFNDPIEVPDAALRAVSLGCALREEMAELTSLWQKRGYDLDFGAGLALGYATCGEVGFEGRADYAAIGAVTNLASRLADEATAGQILISQRLYAEVEDDVEVEPVGEFTLKGFQRPVPAFNVVAVREKAELSAASGS
jgi:adenylate cyclase